MFMTQEKLADLLIEYSDVVRLAIFGHTHLDELRLLQPESHSGQAESESGVPVKIVPSISPVNGNNPSFTVAQINPESGRLMDYQVFAGSNQTGVDSAWNEEYSYSETYHQASFSPVALKKLISEFKADPQAKTAESQAYIRYCFVGDRSPVLKPLWPYYVCAMSHNTPAGFTACACSPQHEASRSRKP
jgi:sphingomyelin phosphodiesterase acid-like 3